jgi:hypothetical protein
VESYALNRAVRSHEYQLPPDLYRKARNRGRINFVSQLLVWVYSFFILWVLLRAKVAVRFRDWAERVSRYRVLQAFVFVPLLAFTIGVFQLPLAVFDEWVLKLYRISVQPWASWLEDWATNQVIVILAATILDPSSTVLSAKVRDVGGSTPGHCQCP